MRKVWGWLAWQVNLLRAWMHPARYIRRAAWHVGMEWPNGYLNAATLLLVAADYVEKGEGVPAWLFRR
jgi:hypothetical protein